MGAKNAYAARIMATKAALKTAERRELIHHLIENSSGGNPLL